MNNQNLAILVGNVGCEPIFKEFGDKQKLYFSLATSKKVKDKEFTQWHQVECWSKRQIQVVSGISKGDRVYVSGEIKYSKWTDKDGVDKVSTIINAGIMGILSQKESKGNGGSVFDKHEREQGFDNEKTPTYDVDSDKKYDEKDPF